MRKILNLTPHVASPSQVADGVVEPINKKEVQDLLTFTGLPERELVVNRAEELAEMVGGYPDVTHAMIGGAPYLMAPLEYSLRRRGIVPVYSYTERKSVESHQSDGTVVKTNVFEHVGWVEVEL